jgi:hypothetical protein
VNPFSRSRPTLPAAAPASAPPQGFSSLPDQSVRPACSRKARLPFTPVGSSLPADLLLNSRYRGSSFQTRYAQSTAPGCPLRRASGGRRPAAPSPARQGPLIALAWTSEKQTRISSAVLVERSRSGLDAANPSCRQVRSGIRDSGYLIALKRIGVLSCP